MVLFYLLMGLSAFTAPTGQLWRIADFQLSPRHPGTLELLLHFSAQSAPGATPSSTTLRQWIPLHSVVALPYDKSIERLFTFRLHSEEMLIQQSYSLSSLGFLKKVQTLTKKLVFETK